MTEPQAARFGSFVRLLLARRIPLSARIFARIMTGSLVTVVITSVLAAFTIAEMSRWEQQVRDINERIPPARSALEDLRGRTTLEEQAVAAYVTGAATSGHPIDAYLNPYRQAQGPIAADVTELERLAAAFPALQAAVGELAGELRVRGDELQAEVAAAQAGMASAQYAALVTAPGAGNAQAVAAALTELEVEISSLQEGQIRSFQETAEQTRWVVGALFVLGTITATATGLWLASVVAGSLAQRQQDIEAANARLTEVSRLKSQFVATMSHELRTPLNAIIGFSEMLQREAVGPLHAKQRRYVDNILHSGRHLLALINDVLDLSKVEAGKMEIKVQPIVVADLLRESAAVIRGMADQKEITVEAVPPPSDLVVSGDLGRLRQVLFNLLSNAVKFTPAGGRVRVAAQAVGTFTHVSVEDTGIGIAKEDQERIFEEFQQVDSSASREFQGTGLGLALSRRLIQLHGGTLTVRSEPGKGSIFTFVLPAADTELAA